MAVTIKDIAKELNVSTATVSLALNDRNIVSKKTADMVKETAARMGYVRNTYARGLVLGRSSTIALVVPDIENGYYSSLVKHVALESRVSGFDVSIHITNESIENEWRIMRRLVQRNIEAILLAPTNQRIRDPEYGRWLDECRVPIVFVTAYHAGISKPFVMCNIEEGMKQLAEHVIAKGAKSILLFSGPENVETFYMREKGFMSAINAANVSGNIVHVQSVTYQGAYETMVRQLGSGTRPDAIMCANDMMGLGVMNALHDSGLRIPDDILLTGFDDGLYSKLAAVPLTTVSQNVEEMARVSLEAAINIVRGVMLAQDTYVKCSIVPRKSTER